MTQPHPTPSSRNASEEQETKLFHVTQAQPGPHPLPLCAGEAVVAITVPLKDTSFQVSNALREIVVACLGCYNKNATDWLA